MDKGETRQAAENLAKVVQLLPDYAEGHLALAQALAMLGDVEAGIPEFKRALELQPTLYAAQFGLGQLLRKNENLAEANTSLREAIRLRPSSAEAYNVLGLVLSGQADWNGSAAAFQKALQIDPGDVAAQENLAAIAIDIDKRAAPTQTALSNSTASAATLSSAALNVFGVLNRGADSECRR